MNRFWSKVKKTPTCWLWTASTRKNGYGQFNLGGANVTAHRYSYEEYNGPIPKGKWVLHTCDVRNCVNPKHLWLGDRQDNMIDCIDKGRHNKAKLSPAQVRNIRESSKSSAELAAEHGVHQSSIYNIQKGKTWRHLLC